MKITMAALKAAGACSPGRRWFEAHFSAQEITDGVDVQSVFDALAGSITATDSVPDWATWLVDNIRPYWELPVLHLNTPALRNLKKNLFYAGDVVSHGDLTLGPDTSIVIGGDLTVKCDEGNDIGKIKGGKNSRVHVVEKLACGDITLTSGELDCGITCADKVTAFMVNVKDLSCQSLNAEDVICADSLQSSENVTVKNALHFGGDVRVIRGDLKVGQVVPEVECMAQKTQCISVGRDFIITQDKTSSIENVNVDVGRDLKTPADFRAHLLVVGGDLKCRGKLSATRNIRAHAIDALFVGICQEVQCYSLKAQNIEYVQALWATELRVAYSACLGNAAPLGTKSIRRGDISAPTVIKSELRSHPPVDDGIFEVDFKGNRRYLMLVPSATTKEFKS